MALKRIIINRHVVKANKDHGKNDPPISVHRTWGGKKVVEYGHTVAILGPSTVIYDKEDSPCSGAHAWIETHSEVVVVKLQEGQEATPE